MPTNNPSAITWQAIESRCRSNNFDYTLSANVFDPLWIISTQWRVGEFKGEDTGSPLFTRVHMENSRVTRFKSLTGDVQPFPGEIPVECIIQREKVEMDLKMQMQMGRHWLKLLKLQALSGNYDSLFKEHFPFEEASGPEKLSNNEALQVRNAAQGRIPNGGALYEFLISDNGKTAVDLDNFMGSGNFSSGDVALIDQTIGDFISYFQRLYSQPEGDESSWVPEKMEYQAACSLPHHDQTGQQVVLKTERYYGGKLEWYNFNYEADPNAALVEPTGVTIDDNVHSAQTASRMHTGVTLAGMAPERWWQFQEGNFNYAAVPRDKTDVLSLIVGDFLLGYSNDWSIIPYNVPRGSLSKVTSVVVKDVFGDYVYAGGELDSLGNEMWSMFNLSHTDNPSQFKRNLFLPPVAAQILSGAPVEQVNLVRDDMALMAWAVEERLPDELGGSMDGTVAANNLVNCLRTENLLDPFEEDTGTDTGTDTGGTTGTDTGTGTGSNSDEETQIHLFYKLIKSAPENWIPLVPKSFDNKVQLTRARIPRILFSKLVESGPIHFIEPRGRIMRAGLDSDPAERLSFFKEEVPQTGTIVTRKYFRTRWYDGSVHTWMGRERTSGLGPGLSGLEFDLFLTEQEQIELKEIDMAKLTDEQRQQILQTLSPSFIYNNLTPAQKELLVKAVETEEVFEMHPVNRLVQGYDSMVDQEKKLEVYLGIADHAVYDFKHTTSVGNNTPLTGTTVLANTIEFEKVDEAESDNYADLEINTIDTSSVETSQQLPFHWQDIR